MNDPNMQGVNQKIFQMGLSVETVSVYLLCAGLADSETKLTEKNLTGIWNGTPSQLRDGLADLVERNVLSRVVSDENDRAVYRIVASDKWRCH